MNPPYDADADIQALTTLPQDITSQPVAERICTVQTCGGAMHKKCLCPLVFTNCKPLKVIPTEIAHMQESCPSLSTVHTRTRTHSR